MRQARSFGNSEVAAQTFEKNDGRYQWRQRIVRAEREEAMIAAWAGTRVVFLEYGGPHRAGMIIEQRLEKYLKEFAVRCDGGAIRYASGSELALEGDPAYVPLKARSMVL
jgi:hypothetical protein